MNLLRQGKHGNPILQNSYNKYGLDCFEFEILEYCEPDSRFELEQLYLDIYKPELNVASFATGAERKKVGRRLTDNDIREIFSMYADGAIAKVIKAAFNLKGGSILGLILDRHIYWDIEIDTPIYAKVKKRRENNLVHGYDRKLTAKDVLEIANNFIKGDSIIKLSNDFNISISEISNILDGKSYKEIKRPTTIRKKFINKKGKKDE